jgi:hypothetical protein
MGRGIGRILLAFCVLAALPAVAQAETRTFVNLTGLGPTGGAGTTGPTNLYPSSIAVSGVVGTVTDVNATLLDPFLRSDADMVLRGPNGQQVMLISDACDQGTPENVQNITFDDSAPGFPSQPGQCTGFQQTYRPANYLPVLPDPDDNSTEPDDLSDDPGGPPPPYLNRMAFLAGGSPNGSWDLFVRDDNSLGFVGFQINGGWLLTLEVDPTQPPPPSVPSNQFTIGDLDGKRLSVEVTSAGTVTVSNAGPKNRLKTSRAAGGPGTVEVKLKLTKPAKRKLKRAGKVKAKAEVTFAPTAGTPASQTEKLKVRKP